MISCCTEGFPLESARPMKPGKPDYGIDAPRVIGNLLVFGFGQGASA
jgi:hypothetical protein